MTIDEVEIFQPGIYPQGDFTEADLDAIVNSYDPSVHHAPVTIDHKQDGPAYGWVQGLKRIGQTIVAKLGQVNEEFKEAIASGAYKKRSIELYSDFDSTGKPYLKALSFLGAKIPQVKGLADIKLSETSHGPVEIFDMAEDIKQKMDFKQMWDHWYQATNALMDAGWDIKDDDGSIESKKDALKDLARQFKDILDSEEFREMPKEDKDKKEPKVEPNVNDKIFSEDQVSTIVEQAVTKATTSFAEQITTLKGDVETERKGRLTIEANGRREEAKRFMEDLERQGKALPAWRKLGIERFMESLEGNEVIEFGENDKRTPGQWFRNFLGSMPEFITFGETQRTDWDKDTTDHSKLLDQKTLDFQEKNPDYSYGQAMVVVLKENPELSED